MLSSTVGHASSIVTIIPEKGGREGGREEERKGEMEEEKIINYNMKVCV